MDLRTGRTYESIEAARAAGVPESDIAEIVMTPGQKDILDGLRNLPEVRFAKGPFKGRVYKRTDEGHLVRVGDDQ